MSNGADIKGTASARIRGALEKSVEQIVRESGYTNLAEEIAVTVVEVSDPKAPRSGSYRGDVRIYPASVIKLFYLEAAHRWMEEGKIADTSELRRAMRDMIMESYNEATHYVIDVITGTSSGQELPLEEMQEWERKRNAINRYFEGRGYTNINVNQKPWGEGPYGRERVFVGEKFTNRNMLTTDATARLMTEIVTGKAVTASRSAEMLQLMQRDPFDTTGDADSQARGFTGPAVPAGAKLWSKAGWTSQTRHDAAYIEFPNGRKLVLVIFTVNHANERDLIPKLARAIILNMEWGTYESPKNVGGKTVR
ncbi:MAG: serine hydrolase [Limisphaerales bacterium]